MVLGKHVCTLPKETNYRDSVLSVLLVLIIKWSRNLLCRRCFQVGQGLALRPCTPIVRPSLKGVKDN